MNEGTDFEEVNNNGDVDAPNISEKVQEMQVKTGRVNVKFFVASEPRKHVHGQSVEPPRNKNGLKEHAYLGYKTRVRKFPRGKFQCDTCGKTFTSKQSLKYHFKVHAGDYGFKCEGCGKRFIKQTRMQKCMDNHDGIFRFQCTQCDYKTNTASVLRRHQATHSSERPFVCPLCDRTYKTKKVLRTHVKMVHSKTIEEAEFVSQKSRRDLSLKNFDNVSKKISEPLVLEGIKSELCETGEIKLKEFVVEDSKCDVVKNIQLISMDKNIKCQIDTLDVIKEQEKKPDYELFKDDSKADGCKACGCGLDDGESLEEHLVSRHLTIEGQCDVCGEESDDFIDHFSIHLGDGN